MARVLRLQQVPELAVPYIVSPGIVELTECIDLTVTQSEFVGGCVTRRQQLYFSCPGGLDRLRRPRSPGLRGRRLLAAPHKFPVGTVSGEPLLGLGSRCAEQHVLHCAVVELNGRTVLISIPLADRAWVQLAVVILDLQPRAGAEP